MFVVFWRLNPILLLSLRRLNRWLIGWWSYQTGELAVVCWDMDALRQIQWDWIDIDGMCPVVPEIVYQNEEHSQNGLSPPECVEPGSFEILRERQKNNNWTVFGREIKLLELDLYNLVRKGNKNSNRCRESFPWYVVGTLYPAYIR